MGSIAHGLISANSFRMSLHKAKGNNLGIIVPFSCERWSGTEADMLLLRGLAAYIQPSRGSLIQKTYL